MMTSPVTSQSAGQSSWEDVAAENSEMIDKATKARLHINARKLLWQLLRPQRNFGLIALVVIIGENLANLAGPLLIAGFMDTGIPAMTSGNPAPLAWYVIGYAVASVTGALFRYIFLRISGRVGQDILVDIRQRLFLHAQRLSLSFHESYTSGKLISRITADTESLDELLEMGLDSLLSSALTLVGTTAVLLWLNVPLALVVLVGFIPGIAVTRSLQRLSRSGYRKRRNVIAKIVVHFSETMNGIRTVQSFRREDRNSSIMEQLNIQHQEAKITSAVASALLVGSMRLIGDLSLIAVLVLGAVMVADGNLEIGVLAAFTLYLRQVYEPLDDLVSFADSYLSVTSALEKISGVLNEKPLVIEANNPVSLAKTSGTVQIKDVKFRYSEETPVVLSVPELVIPAGQTVALVGETGAGKTTLAKLIARFYDPIEGVITLDDIDLREISDAELRRAICTVTQESFLFSGSVADNIAIGNPRISRADIELAATMVGAHEFISALPNGYDTEVRKRGTRLSAGQRQLVSLARALIADPAVLVLDEATSSMDIPSERTVQHALRTVLANRTALVIAHRLSTVLIADRVLVVDAGRIAEDGSPSELIAQRGQFARLHQAWIESLA